MSCLHPWDDGRDGHACVRPIGHDGPHKCGCGAKRWSAPVVPTEQPAVWCYCYEGPEPAGPWIFPDDAHADNHSMAPVVPPTEPTETST